MTGLFIGLMSGTSLDGIDAVLARISPERFELLATSLTPYPGGLRDQLQHAIDHPELCGLPLQGELANAIAQVNADAVHKLCGEAGVAPADIEAIGFHGQTVFHAPDAEPHYSVQLGNAARLARLTGATVVGDLRAADLAANGQGAPLVLAFHRFLFGAADSTRCVVNIGGIANITVIENGEVTAGYDTGPGNTLMDSWVHLHRGLAYDESGEWAATGMVNEALLAALLSEPYLARPAPKSTGRELFNLPWLEQVLTGLPETLQPEDVQATLAEFTARTIANTVVDGADVAVCGGGARNAFLMQRLGELCRGNVTTTADWGCEPKWVEAGAFAWLAWARLAGVPGNVPAATGADAPVLLGGIHSAPFDIS